MAAKYVNETAVICLSPGDNTGSDPRNVTVNFAENGSDFETAPGEYLFFGAFVRALHVRSVASVAHGTHRTRNGDSTSPSPDCGR